jgi:Holliday junction resolvase RusA-like endonuclease
MLLFEFVVAGPPVSQQSRRRERVVAWRQAVAEAARAAWPVDAPPIATDIAVTITYFYEGVPADVDNIVKPILDALKGIAFSDDRQISDLVSQRRPLAGPYIIAVDSPKLTQGLGLGYEFLHVAVSSPPANAQLTVI